MQTFTARHYLSRCHYGRIQKYGRLHTPREDDVTYRLFLRKKRHSLPGIYGEPRRYRRESTALHFINGPRECTASYRRFRRHYAALRRLTITSPAPDIHSPISRGHSMGWQGGNVHRRGGASARNTGPRDD